MSSLSLKTLKCQLLKKLNEKPVEDLTDNEADLTFYLSQDPDVQEHLSAMKSVENDLRRMRSDQMERSRKDGELRVAIAKIYREKK